MTALASTISPKSARKASGLGDVGWGCGDEAGQDESRPSARLLAGEHCISVPLQCPDDAIVSASVLPCVAMAAGQRRPEDQSASRPGYLVVPDDPASESPRIRGDRWSREIGRMGLTWALMGVWGLLPLMPFLAAL